MISPPRFMFVELNRRCNLRCEHCTYWTRSDDRAFYLSKERIGELAAEFAEMNPEGTLVTCGGEPMLDPDEYFHYTATARRLGLGCFSVINGTRVTRVNAERLLREGPSEITVSLDSPYAEKHDAWRGVKGSWEVATRAVSRLVGLRKGILPKINVMMIVCERSYRDLDAYYDLVLNRLGADRAKLNIIQPTFGASPGEDEFFSRNIVQDVPALVALLQACDTKYGLRLNPVWIKQVEGYFESLLRPQQVCIPTARLHGPASKEPRRGWNSQMGTVDHICNTYDRNIMVDAAGFARLCFSHGFRGMQLKKRGDLRQFWFEFAEPIRASMRQCNRYCGISHSVRKQHATVKEGGMAAW